MLHENIIELMFCIFTLLTFFNFPNGICPLIGPGSSPLAEGSGNTVVYDNFFLYGYDIADNNSSGLIKRTQNSFEEIMNERKQQLVTDMAAFTAQNPSITYMPEYNPSSYPNMKALVYEGANRDGKKTKVFAYLGVPANLQANAKLPAVVLVHGGGGHAFAEWVSFWNNKGYIALAMDNTGYFPAKNGSWVWGLSKNADFNEEGFANVPDNDNFSSSNNKLDQQWMYHAVAQTILAKNILANFPQVDPSKVGVVGISWGSKIVAQAIGFDKFAFAVCQYVSAYLDESLTHNAQYSKKYKGFNYLWVAESRFDAVDFPVLWSQWTKDASASIISTSSCYLDVENSILSLRMNWMHGHDWTTPIEIYRFADSVVNGGQPLTTVAAEPSASRNINFAINTPLDAAKVTAKAYYITEKMTYSNKSGSYTPMQTFYSVNLSVNDNKVTGILPKDAYSFYVEISTTIGGKVYYTATAFRDVDSTLITPKKHPIQ